MENQKKKLSLEDLKVESFVTTFSQTEVLGGETVKVPPPPSHSNNGGTCGTSQCMSSYQSC